MKTHHTTMKTHHTIAACIAALAFLPSVLNAEDLIKNGNFEAEMQGWFLDQHSPAMATTTFQTTDPDGKTAIEIEVVEPGEQAWQVQLVQGGCSISVGKIYTLAFYAKAEPELYGAVAALAQAVAPYGILASKGELTLTTGWKKFEVELTPSADEPTARVVFSNLGGNSGKVWISQVSLIKND